MISIDCMWEWTKFHVLICNSISYPSTDYTVYNINVQVVNRESINLHFKRYPVNLTSDGFELHPSTASTSMSTDSFVLEESAYSSTRSQNVKPHPNRKARIFQISNGRCRSIPDLGSGISHLFMEQLFISVVSRFVSFPKTSRFWNPYF